MSLPGLPGPVSPKSVKRPILGPNQNEDLQASLRPSASLIIVLKVWL